VLVLVDRWCPSEPPRSPRSRLVTARGWHDGAFSAGFRATPTGRADGVLARCRGRWHTAAPQVHIGGSIDPHPFIHHDGTPLLLWKAANAIGQQSTLFAQRLRPDGLALTGPTRGATHVRGHVGAASHRKPGPRRCRQLLRPAVLGWLVGIRRLRHRIRDLRNPLGPCIKATVDGVRSPLFASASAGDQAGPGRATIVTGAAGDDWLAYHAWSAGAVGYNNGGTRSLRFAALTWSDAQPVITR
jgi:hypothetical protein